MSELFSSDRANFAPIMELFKEMGNEVGEAVIRLTKLILSNVVTCQLFFLVTQVHSQTSLSTVFIGTTL